MWGIENGQPIVTRFIVLVEMENSNALCGLCSILTIFISRSLSLSLYVCVCLCERMCMYSEQYYGFSLELFINNLFLLLSVQVFINFIFVYLY